MNDLLNMPEGVTKFLLMDVHLGGCSADHKTEFDILIGLNRKLTRSEKITLANAVIESARELELSAREYARDLKARMIALEKPTEDRSLQRGGGFVYLMRNGRNGFTKIGYSRSPKHREKTLQSEEPEVEIIFSAKAQFSLEQSLHDKFARKRVRGEWFNLSAEDIEAIQKQIGGAQ